MSQQYSHRRQNLLNGEWVLVSPHRRQRPWQGQVEAGTTPAGIDYDPDCYLCPGNSRAGAHINPPYSGPYAFDNDFPALSPDSPDLPQEHPLLISQADSGICRVVCYSEQHDLCLADMSLEQIVEALRFLIAQNTELEQRDNIGYVQVFENHGQMMGCSNPHPHAQIWATRSLPTEVRKELEHQRAFHYRQGRILLLDYLATELDAGVRIVHQNKNAVSLVPYWALWPFETLLLPRWPIAGFEDLDADTLRDFADVLKKTLLGYNRLFDTRVPYSLGFHPRPGDGEAHPEWQFHAHIYPPLLRSAGIRKHQVGFEMLGMPQRDLTPEDAAQSLRSMVL